MLSVPTYTYENCTVCCAGGPLNCTNPGPCASCLACEGSTYPPAWRVEAEQPFYCFGREWVLANSAPLPDACGCPYGCENGEPPPRNAGAALNIYPHPNGIRKAGLYFSGGQVPTDIYASYSTQNWNCCGTNVLTLNPDSANCNAAPTRTLTPVGNCDCLYPGNWCSRRVPTVQCLVRGLTAHTYFNNRIIPCYWGQGIFNTGWASQLIPFNPHCYEEDDQNYCLEITLTCSGQGRPLGDARWSAGAAIKINGGQYIEGNDHDGNNTSVCQPVFYDGTIILREHDTKIPVTPIRLTFTE